MIWIVVGCVVLVGGSVWYTYSPMVVTTMPHLATSTPAQSSTTPSSGTSSQPKKPIVASTSTVLSSEITEPQMGHNGWKYTIATVFWVGEGATADNGYIQNAESAWDGEWMQHFGGVDDPDTRCGFKPCEFIPKENSFYVALPYNDLNDQGDRKNDAHIIPWNNPAAAKSVLKNRWIEVRLGSVSCFGQWEDVGPFYEDDGEYVFGSALMPKNIEGEKAGIDLSPAMRDCLKTDGSSEVFWRHVVEKDVPMGPWKETITTRVSQ